MNVITARYDVVSVHRAFGGGEGETRRHAVSSVL